MTESVVSAYAKRVGRPLDTDLILGATLVHCAWPGCKEWTYWRRARQYKHGTCITHAVTDPGAISTAQLATTLGAAFPGALVALYRPERWPRGVYGEERERVWFRAAFALSGVRIVRSLLCQPLDTGPCSRCQAPIRRYGDQSYPLCMECDEETKNDRQR